MPRREIAARVAELLSLVQLTDLAARFPHELSGGQQQRVALARALALQPSVLLLDEPLSNLDAKLRLQMREEIRNLVSTLRITTIFVTHDQEEALAISDRMVVMNNGQIEQIGSPIDVYESPATRFVAQFIGACNLIPVRRGARGEVLLPAGATISLDRTWPREDSMLAVRPEHLRIADLTKASMSGHVQRVIFLGSSAHVRADIAGQEIIIQTTAAQARSLAAGMEIGVEIDLRHVQLL
jgi:putative spermidine/putrescine transport system ATP-binding protein